MSASLNLLIEYKDKVNLETNFKNSDLSKISDYCFEILKHAINKKLAVQIHMRDYGYKFLWRDLQMHEMVLDISGSYVYGNAEDILDDDYQEKPTSLMVRLSNLQAFISELLKSELINNLYLYFSDDDVLEENYTSIDCKVENFSSKFTEIINTQNPFAYKVRFEK